MIAGIIILGVYVLAHFGGFSNFMAEAAKLDPASSKFPV
jgi:hypothetical protein